MKRSSLTLSFAGLLHLLIVDFICYFLSFEVPMNLFVVVSYNIFWVILIILIGTQKYHHRSV